MKKRVTAGIAVGLSALLSGAFSVGVMAEENTAYQLGDMVNNFVITSFADETVSLDELLAEKDVVLINMWSSWSESSAKQTNEFIQLSEELGDQVGILEVTSGAWDTLSEAEEIWMRMVDPSLTEETAENLIGGEIPRELAEKFAPKAYPTTYLIDKNHMLCFVHEGLISDMDAFGQQLEQVYTADSYGESVLLEELPESENTRKEEDETQLSEVLTDGKMEITNLKNDPIFEIADVSPFLLNDDASAVYPSNQGEGNSLSVLKIDFSADAGSLLALDYRMDHTAPNSGMLLLHVDDRLENTIRKDTEDWETAYITVKSTGNHELYLHYLATANAEDHLEVGNIRLLTAEEAAQVHDLLEKAPKTLEEQEGRIEMVDIEDAKKLKNSEFDGDTTEKWIAEGAEAVRLKIQVGEAFKLNNAMITISQRTSQETSDFSSEMPGLGDNVSMVTVEGPGEEQMIFLKDLEWDEEGFYLDLTLCEGANTIMLAASPLSENAAASLTIYTSEEAPVQEVMQMMSAFGNNPDILEALMELFRDYVFEDGTPLYPDIEAIRQAAGIDAESDFEDETEEEMVSYTLHIRTEVDKAVEGVITQWFDEDGMMQTAATDENGDAVITGAPGDYTIHILVLPKKFAEVTENLMIENDETEHTLTVYYR